MNESIVIASRFHGPPRSGNGGYSCGMLGKHINGPAAVRLRIPPPLDTAMTLRREDDALALYHEEQLVATARPVSVDMIVPDAPGYGEALAASGRYRGLHSHFYPGCFVCGPEREAGDGLRVFAGPLNSEEYPGGMVAAVWTPDDSLVDASGELAPEFIWAVLDCPGAYSFPEPAEGAILLGELAVSIKETVSPGEKCVITGWQIRQEGRKHYTGTALFGSDGACKAMALATWFEVPTAPA
jgi:hypothetical protein